MNRILLIISMVGLTSMLSCHRNPITGRKQLTLVSEKEVQSMALTQYKQFLTTSKVVPVNNTDGEMVKRVGARIADAIGRYYQQQGLASALDGYNWDVNLVQSNEVNALCMPGGKGVVY